MKAERPIALFLCGDVMTGRAVDQVLPHPGDPRIQEYSLQTATAYVQLAEQANGPIPAHRGFAYVWGDALEELDRRRPDARIVNLETSVTRSESCWPKGINYRMHPENVPCLTAARIDCCVLANNHVLDYGYDGLRETLDTLRRAGVRTAGAGRNRSEASAPAVIDVPGAGRVLVFGFGTETSGIPSSWAARANQPGIQLLWNLSEETISRVAEAVRERKQPRDVVVASIHWGGNWGFDVPAEHVQFAHELVRAGVDVVHGHSSHHVRPIEVLEGRLVLYGCGDFLDDYEGIGGYRAFRADLRAMYFVTVDPASGRLVDLRMVPTRMRRLRVERAAGEDARWLRDTINRESRRFGFQVALDDDGTLVPDPGDSAPVPPRGGPSAADGATPLDTRHSRT